MKRIESSKNQLVKLTKKLLTAKYREESGLMLLEGMRLIETALQAGLIFKYLFINQRIFNDKRWNSLNSCLKGLKIDIYLVSDNIIKETSSTDSPQGILAVVKIPSTKLVHIISDSKPLILIIDQVRDPGNLGTIIRSADAAGCSGIICGKGTVDLGNPKVLRSSMGSVFHLPIIPVEDLRETIIKLKKRGIEVIAADTKGDSYYYDLDLNKPTAIILGNEAEGISSESLTTVDRVAKIPMIGKAESLNVAIAASLFLYEAVRQRRV